MLLIVVGLQREARIAAAPHARIVVGAGRSAALTHALGAALADGQVTAVLSFGVAGALDPDARVGDVVVPGEIVAEGGESLAVDHGWSARLRVASGASGATMLGSDAVIDTAAQKRNLRRATGAVAVDMESHCAARAAVEHALPFAALRVISDRADHALPRSATVGMRADGAIDAFAVLAALARAPWEAPALIRTGRDAGVAFGRLAGVRARTGRGFMFERRSGLEN